MGVPSKIAFICFVIQEGDGKIGLLVSICSIIIRIIFAKYKAGYVTPQFKILNKPLLNSLDANQNSYHNLQGPC